MVILGDCFVHIVKAVNKSATSELAQTWFTSQLNQRSLNRLYNKHWLKKKARQK